MKDSTAAGAGSPAREAKVEAPPGGPAGAAQGAPAKPRRALYLGCAVALAGALLIGILVAAAAGVGLLVEEGISAARQSDGLIEKVESGSGEDKIVRICLTGIIMEGGGGLWGAEGDVVSGTVKRLRRASADADVKAVILEVNSPGGGVTASDIIYNEVLATKKAGKKVVVLMGDVAASGGYYVSAPADSIMAHPTTITGSIGVIFTTINIGGLLAEHKVQAITIKSAPMKDIGSAFRAMTDEERRILQEMIDEMYGRFVGIVAAGRSMPREKVLEVAQGQIYAAKKAKDLGLVDSIGYWDDALAEAMKLAGTSEAKVVTFSSTPGLIQLLSGEMRGRGLPPTAAALAEALTLPRPMFLWMPGN